MEFKNYLEKTATEIELEINKILIEWGEEGVKWSPKLKSLMKSFAKSTQGGKKIRGSLVKLGYELAGAELKLKSSKLENKEILKVAAAYEIFHAAILAHDDIIDLSPIRRGKPSLYQALGGDHYGISQAICLGDIGFFIATKVIAETKFEEKYKNFALQQFSKLMLNTALGEMLDVEKGDVLTIMKLKTGQYTISGPVQIGAILAGLSPSSQTFKHITEFGENLGIAFQIQDDVLGIFGEELELGKSITSDIEEGKNTLLIVEALRRSNKHQLKVLDQYYGKGSIDQVELEKIKQVFIQTKALEYAKTTADKYMFKALEILPRITKDQDLNKIFMQMAEYLVNRTK